MPLSPLRKLLSDDRGNITMIFGLVSVPLFGFCGVAIDYGLATRLEAKLQAATDATALSLCQTSTATLVPALQLQAQTMMGGYMGANTGLVVDPVTMTMNPRKILLAARANSQTYFGKLTGTATLVVAAKAQCATPVPKTFEIALVLDTTGSMAKSSGSQSKMDAAKEAAGNFVDYVKSNASFAADSRMSIVPFAASVAVDPTAYRSATWIDQLGTSAYHWTNVDKSQANASGFINRFAIFDSLKSKVSSWGWGGCLETPPYPQNVQDGVPTSADSRFVPLFAPDEPGGGSVDRVTYWDSNDYTYYYTYNSYLDDSTDAINCKPATSTKFSTDEKRACKYVSPKNTKSTATSDVGTPNGPNFGCTSLPLQRLTIDATTLKALIGRLAPLGATNIHEGLMWGWRTLSPSSVFADGAAYSSLTTNKVIVLMTDGANSWSDNSNRNWNETLYFSMGYFRNADGTTPADRLPPSYQNVANTTQARNALDELTRQGCTNAKAAGISIYTIGFSVPIDPIDTQGINLLSDCATSSSQAYVANDSASLIAAFDSIAKSIGAVRLTQ